MAALLRRGWRRLCAFKVGLLLLAVHGSEDMSFGPRRLGTCVYVQPKVCPPNEGWDGMWQLTDPGWKAPPGSAGSGERMLLYAYGPMFANRGQIGAWMYNPDTNYIEFYWSKQRCPGMCKSCCGGGKGNEPGVVTVKLNPSASNKFGYALTTKFMENEQVKLPFGRVFLRHVGNLWRFENTEGGCYLDHVYVYSQSSYVAMGMTKDGKPCSFGRSGHCIGGTVSDDGTVADPDDVLDSLADSPFWRNMIPGLCILVISVVIGLLALRKYRRKQLRGQHSAQRQPELESTGVELVEPPQPNFANNETAASAPATAAPLAGTEVAEEAFGLGRADPLGSASNDAFHAGSGVRFVEPQRSKNWSHNLSSIQPPGSGTNVVYAPPPSSVMTNVASVHSAQLGSGWRGPPPSYSAPPSSWQSHSNGLPHSSQSYGGMRTIAGSHPHAFSQGGCGSTGLGGWGRPAGQP